MKRFSIRNIAPVVLTGVLLFMPLVVLGQGYQTNGPTGSDYQTNGPTGSSFPGTPTPNTNGSVTPSCNGGACSVQNPLAVSNFCDLLKIVLQALLILGLPVAVIFLVLAGLRYIIAYGKPEAITLANKNLMYTVIGVAVFLGAWTIAQIIKATLVSLGVGGFGSC